MMRRTPLRRTAMRRRSRPTSYSRRPRDLPYMLFVKTLLCSVEEERPDPDREPTPCWGVIEADHAGRRGISQKADDRTVIPICTGHHRERTDHTGSFKHTTRESNRAWLDRAITRTQTIYAERNGDTIA
jgi:hypothetical protein